MLLLILLFLFPARENKTEVAVEEEEHGSDGKGRTCWHRVEASVPNPNHEFIDDDETCIFEVRRMWFGLVWFGLVWVGLGILPPKINAGFREVVFLC